MNKRNSKENKILVVDDNKSVLSAISMLLSGIYKETDTLSDPNRIPEYMQRTGYDVILLDMNFRAGINSGNEGLFWLNEILKRDSTVSVIMITAYGDIELAVKAVQRGAVDFVLKPWDNRKLLATVQAAIKLHHSRYEVNILAKDRKNLKKALSETGKEDLIGTSDLMKEMKKMIGKVAATDASILITGENGSGKEVVARTIHAMSSRSNEVMVTVDMGSVVDSLFESELFGHRKGAFTDASDDRTGKIELANEGTLFLDEIGNLSLNLQAKLLSVLQNRTVTPVGGNTPVKIDLRLICATNRDLEQMVSEGTFREDLLYRINTITLRVPPLRERTQDIEPLAAFFIERYADKYMRHGTTISSPAMQELKNYSWPGNVRELQHTIEKAVILCENRNIEPPDLMLKRNTPSMNRLDDISIDEMEKRLISSAVTKFNGNMSAVAKQLGITRQTLYNKMKKYGI